MIFNPLAPGNFAKKCLLKQSQAVFRSLSSQKESRLSKTLFTSRALDQLSFLMPHYSLRSSGMRRKQNFKALFFEKASPAPSSFTFCFLFSPHSFAFLSPFFFFFCRAFTRLPFGVKRFCEKFEDREYFFKEARVSSGARFSSEFSGQSYTVFCVFLRSV